MSHFTVYLIAGSKRQARSRFGHEDGLPARERFKGALFVRSLEYAEAARGERDDVLILSGVHGLLSPDDPIRRSDFDLAFTSRLEREGWGMLVASRLIERYKGRRPDFIILAGRDFADALAPHLPRVERPFDGMKGNGEMLAWLNDQLAALTAETLD